MERSAVSIVSKVGQVLLDELQDIGGVGDKVVQLRDELATMNAVLRIISEADQDKVDHIVREWEKQVHDLVYDAEDCTDTYLLRIVRPTPCPPNDVVGAPLTSWARYQLARAKRNARYHFEKLMLHGTLLRPLPPEYDADGAPLIFPWARYLLASANRIARYPYEKLVLQRTLAADIKDLLARTTTVSKRRARYGIDRATLPRAAWFARVSAASISANALRRADNPDQFVGITEQASTLARKIKAGKAAVHDEEGKIKASFHDPRDKMKALVHDEDDQIKALVHDQDDKIKEPVQDEDDKSLKVFSIVGFGGLGKTTLAMELCRQLDADFPCQAVVSVSQAFDVGKDMKGLLAQVVKQILKANQTSKEKEAQIDNMNVEELSSKIKELLDRKRYLIVIDDVWSLPAWEAISNRLPENNCGSRIIVTTRMDAVAKAASVNFVHQMKPLEQKASEKLFVKRLFSSTENGTCPLELKETMDKILTKCGGLPLDIISIASLLASYMSAEAIEMWERVSRSIGSHMKSHPTLEGMWQLITLSYDYLPHHLKACMMYLSIFPEDYMIPKERLLYKWIAEGLITEKRGLTLLEVAEEYFNELISRNMIQQDKFVSPVNIFNVREKEVEGCRVHDMILEVMVSKSQESNFVSLVGRQYGGMGHGNCKVRRLSIHDNDHDEEHHARNGIGMMKLQHVRSLTTFQRSYGLNKLLDRLGEFKLLRVLDLEDCNSLQNKHMRYVCRLYLLRFLSLRGTNISKMPRKVGNLEHLEILDIENTYLSRKIPGTVTKLRKLEHLKCFRWLLPRGLGNMKALHKVDMGVLRGDNVEVVQEISELPLLHVLGIQISITGELKQEFYPALASSLSKMHALWSLHLELFLRGSLEFLLDVSTPPPLLQCLSLDGPISQLPNWISSLRHLTKFEVGWPEVAGDQIFLVLCKLPNLQSVKLVGIKSKEGEVLVARPEHSFPVLRILKVVRCHTVLTFEEGSMTKLETLVWGFDENDMRLVGVKNLDVGLVGVEKLKNLKEVNLHGYKDNPAMERAMEQLKTLSESKQIKVVADLR